MKGMKMKQREQTETEIKMETKKKDYSSPTIEKIGEVRGITQGSTIGGTDSGGQGARVPSDP